MNQSLREDADQIIQASLNAVLPDEAVIRALQNFRPGSGKILLVAAGKAAWQMAAAAVNVLGHVDGGIVVTKYDHTKGLIPGSAAMKQDTPYRMILVFQLHKRPSSWYKTSARKTLCFFCCPEAAVLYLKSHCSPPKNCRRSPINFLPVVLTL